MVICLERCVDLHMAQLILLPLTVSCFSNIQIGLPFWYRLTWVVPGKGPLNGCVCVCVLHEQCNVCTLWSVCRARCHTRWSVGDWQRCSAACGEGRQRRVVACERALASGHHVTVDTDVCDQSARPTTVRHCRSDKPCHRWRTGPWSRVCSLCQTLLT